MPIMVAITTQNLISKVYLWERFLFGNGSFSLSSMASWLWDSFLPLQFPQETPLHTELTTLSACVFLQKAWTEGFSLVPPRCLCMPKNCSNGSCVNLSLKNVSTPGILNINLTNSTNDFTKKQQKYHTHNRQLYTCDPDSKSCLSGN